MDEPTHPEDRAGHDFEDWEYEEEDEDDDCPRCGGRMMIGPDRPCPRCNG